MQIINPATEEIIREVQEDNAETLREKFDLLKEAQLNWFAVGLEQRIKILQHFS